MTPIELTGLYDILRSRIAAHDLPACTEISLRLSSSFRDEIAFYRLVFWAYALVNEAARIPFDFLTNLPPLRADTSLRTEISQLRTFLAHNLDRRNRRDQRTMAFAQRWFMEACGHSEPNEDIHYRDCCVHLADKLEEALGGAIEACSLLDDPNDGLRLVASLRDRIDIAWPGHRFDRIVSACASRLGNPDVDLLMVRSRHLDSWRRFLARAPAQRREQALEQRIEADLLVAIGDSLPRSVRENIQRIAVSPTATTAALLIFREARQVGAMSLREIIDLVSSQTPGH